MTDPREKFELAQQVSDLGTSRIFNATARGTDAPLLLQIIERPETELAALREALDRGARALSDASLPGRPLEWDVTTRPAWIAYDRFGEPLTSAVQRGRDPSVVAAVATETAIALELLGKVGLVHRSLSPRTIFYSKGRVALLGLDTLRASYQTARADAALPNDPRFTAPEAFEGGGDIKADVYSLGSILYALLTGSPPYFGDPSLLREAHRTQPIPTVPGDDAVGWNEMFAKLLAKDPGHRPQPGEIAALVRKARARTVVMPAVAAAAPVRRGGSRRGPLVAALLAAVALLAVGAFALANMGGLPDGLGLPGPTAGTATQAPAATDPAATPAATAPTGTASAAPTTAPTTAPTAPPRTAPPRTPAPTPPPATPPPGQQPQSQVTPASGGPGTIFQFAFFDLPPGSGFTARLTKPNEAETEVVQRGAVPPDGVVRFSLGTSQQFAKGGYAMSVVAGSVTRAIVFTIN